MAKSKELSFTLNDPESTFNKATETLIYLHYYVPNSDRYKSGLFIKFRLPAFVVKPPEPKPLITIVKLGDLRDAAYAYGEYMTNPQIEAEQFVQMIIALTKGKSYNLPKFMRTFINLKQR